mgnify:CR=1 FL=1
MTSSTSTSNTSNARVALVTGGTGGIGTAICKRLADMGFQMKPMPRENFAEVVKQWDAKWTAKAPDVAALRALPK